MQPPQPPKSKEGDLPATRTMLRKVRAELIAKLTKLERNLDSRFAAIDARFATIDARFAKIDARFATFDARFSKMDARFGSIESKLADITAKVERTNLLVEEQNANNRIVLEGLAALWEKQDRIELKLGAT